MQAAIQASPTTTALRLRWLSAEHDSAPEVASQSRRTEEDAIGTSIPMSKSFVVDAIDDCFIVQLSQYNMVQ